MEISRKGDGAGRPVTCVFMDIVGLRLPYLPPHIVPTHHHYRDWPRTWDLTLFHYSSISRQFPSSSPLPLLPSSCQVTVPPDPMLLDHLAQHGVTIDAGSAAEGDRLHHAFIIQIVSSQGCLGRR